MSWKEDGEKTEMVRDRLEERVKKIRQISKKERQREMEEETERETKEVKV